MCHKFTMSNSKSIAVIHRRRLPYGTKKRPRKFFVVSSHKKKKRAQQFSESRAGEVEPSRIEAATTRTSVGGGGVTSPTPMLIPAVERRPSTSLGVEVVPSSIPGWAIRSGEAQASRNEPPASLRPSSSSAAKPPAIGGEGLPREGLPREGHRRLVPESCYPRLDH